MEEKDRLVSIIVPVYNVEKYLSKCIEILINQTYTNIEILLINDGSTDNSKKICEQFKEKDSRIKLINKENGGLSDARNKGLQEAIGKYIAFVDSDDYVEKNYIETLYSLITKFNSEIAIADFRVIKGAKKIKGTAHGSSFFIIQIFTIYQLVLNYIKKNYLKMLNFQKEKCLKMLERLIN